VRADAPGIFVPVTDLDGAAIGDEVLVQSDEPAGTDRRATIAATEDRDGTSYFRLDFDSPR
jgi:hypothetical protein